jgi:ferric-dicitrate binding protein FerR (iron transport regulator)
MDRGLDRTEDLLRDLRPEPRADFVRELEASLMSQSSRRRRFGTLLAAGALSASLAALTLILSVAGLMPWGLGQSSRVEAGGECKTVTVVRHERRPVLVVDADGKITTDQRVVAVRKPVKRCPSTRGR